MSSHSDTTLDNVEELKALSGIENVRVIHADYGNRLGAARELSNRESRGNYILVMDDDDIYPPRYVENIVTIMKTKKREFVACDKPFMYDYDTDSWYQWTYSPRTCTNNSFAYTRDFAQAHHYNPEDTHAEEKTFVGKELAFPILADYGVIQLSHGQNTVNKRQMIMTPNAATIRKLSERPAMINTLPEGLWDMYMNVILTTVSHTEPEGGEREVVFYCGLQPQGWHPEAKDLGGSEQAVVQLSNEFAKKGYRVFVYMTLPEGINELVLSEEYGGVTFRRCQAFKIRDRHYPRLIVWRKFGYNPLLTKYSHLLNVGKLILDLHDCTTPSQSVMTIPGIQVMVKSDYHKQMFCEKYRDVTFHVIENGVQTKLFTRYPGCPTPRQMYRFVYTSDYSRGIVPFIEHVWPHIVAARPEAELHTYYGGSTSLPAGALNVCNHGRRELEIVAEEKCYLASNHIYLCTTIETEIDCIAIKESSVAGCTPIMFDAGVFRERNGFRIPHQEITAATGKTIADQILDIVDLPEGDVLPEGIAYENSHHISTWSEIATAWQHRVLL